MLVIYSYFTNQISTALTDDEPLYTDLLGVIEGSEEYKAIRSKVEARIGADGSCSSGKLPASTTGLKLGVTSAAARATVPPMQQGTAASVTPAPKATIKRAASKLDDEDYSLDIKEAWEPVMNCEGDAVLGRKFIFNEVDGRQVKLSFSLHLPTGCFNMTDKFLSTEGLHIALDSAGENLLISFPKNKAVNKPLKYTKRAAKIFCDENNVKGKDEKAIVAVLEHQQKMLNMDTSSIDDFFHTKIPLDFPCNVNEVIWFPVVAVNSYMALQVHLTGAQVRRAKAIKVTKIALLDDDDDLPSSQDE